MSFRSFLPKLDPHFLESHRRQSVDAFRSFLTKTRPTLPKSHRRQSVDTFKSNLAYSTNARYSATQMYLTPYTTLTWAYQLHYYICFRTHRRRQLFSSDTCATALTEWIREVASNHDYHLLRQKSYPNQLRCLLSLKPSQSVAKTVQTLKSNSARELARQFNLPVPLWARGYLARSSGKVRTSAVRKYLETQAAHHGYDSRILPPVYKYRATERTIL